MSTQPAIERVYPYSMWTEIEYRILREFQARAGMHMNPAQLPPATPDYKLSWLAIMQHYGAPTRLLDFTSSPLVALYFALRNRVRVSATHAEVWGIDAATLHRQAAKTSREADAELRKRKAQPSKGRRVGFRAEDFSSALQRAQAEDEQWDNAVRNALNPCGVRRVHFDRNGFAAIAMPPVQNARLSSQQGIFVFNGAEDLTFEDSLNRMMQDEDQAWYKRFQIPETALDHIEGQLFHSNIHDLSLFPNTEGLAGFVRQRVRLHW
jgi:FRG domain